MLKTMPKSATQGSSLLSRAGVSHALAAADANEDVWIDVIRKMDSVYAELVENQVELERKNAALEDAQQLIASVLASMTDVLAVYDRFGRIQRVNLALEKLTGLSEARLLGQPLSSLFVPGSVSIAERMLTQLKEDGSITDCEVSLRDASGAATPLSLNCSARFDQKGRFIGGVMAGRPLGELRRAYKRLDAAHRELQAAQEHLIFSEKMAALGRLVAGVAHELNNPLTAILGVTELLREGQADPEATKRQLEITHRQARRAARIVQNLLEFSRPASPQKKPVDLNSIIDRTVQLHEHSLRRNNVEVDFRPQPDYPGVVADANQLIQVFLNLVTNAEQAIREVRESGRIQIRLARVGSRISVTFQDDGVGIRPESVPRLFDPFYTTKRPGGGTGLGLSICLSIVREHGGTIEAEALPAGGSAFTVYLPVAADQTTRPSTNLSGTIVAAAPNLNLLKGKSVLVLDDEESLRSLLFEGLTARELHVDCAATLEEALAFVAKRSHDAIICDINLSQDSGYLNGKLAAERLLAAAGGRKPALIYISGELMEASEGAESSGEPRHLQKPFRISDVLATLQEVFAAAPGGTTPE